MIMALMAPEITAMFVDWCFCGLAYSDVTSLFMEGCITGTVGVKILIDIF